MLGCHVYTDHHAVGRLDELDLEAEVLRESVAFAHGLVLETTDNDPITARGFIFWAKTVRGLRDRHTPKGWTRNEQNKCYPLTVHPERKIAIAVAGGDSDTGREKGRPSTKRAKGQSTKNAVHENQQTFELDGIPKIQKIKGLQTWVLLIHEDIVAEELRIELSLPARVSAEGFVSDWKERIIIPSIPFGDGVRISKPDPSPVLGDDVIDINVARRTG